MATVDLDKIREIECSSENVGTVGALIEFIRGLQWEMEERGVRTGRIHDAYEKEHARNAALIRRVERLIAALQEQQNCKSVHRCEHCLELGEEALKEDPDSVD